LGGRKNEERKLVFIVWWMGLDGKRFWEEKLLDLVFR
jgi:hypothetical protein